MISPVSKNDEALFVRGFKTRCENTAIQIRSHLGLKDTDPLPAREVAKYLDVFIWDLDNVPGLPGETLHHLQSSEGDEWSAVAVRSGTKDIIVLNPSHSVARQANDLMHELAHIILNHKPSQVTVSDSTGIGFRTFDRRQEAEADWLGACLLLPRSAIAASHRQNMDIEAAADYFGVSKDLYKYRVRITGVERQLSRRA